MLLNGDEQYYLSTNRIIGKMSNDKDLYFYDNILYPEFNFKVEGDLDPLPPLLSLLNKNTQNNLKWEKTKRAHERMKTIIKNQMNQLPFLKGYFYLLDMNTFAIYYLKSINSLSSLPDISHSIKKQSTKVGKFYLKVVPSVFPPLPTTKYFIKDYKITFEKLINKINFKIKKEIDSDIFGILDKNTKEYFTENVKNNMVKRIEMALIDDCYQKYGNELLIINKDSLKYLIKDLKYISEDMCFFWIIIINSYKNLIKEIENNINNLSQIYPDLNRDINNFNNNTSLYQKLNIIKGSINNKYEQEQNLYVQLVSERIIRKGLFNSNTFTLAEIEPIARRTLDNELINKIDQYKSILEIKFKVNKLFQAMRDKNFYDLFKIEKPYETKLTIISVGYHEGRASYRGGCLIDFNQEIELKEKNNINISSKIKNAVNNRSEEITIGEQTYFLVKTKIKSLLYDKENLMEVNYSENINLKNIIKIIQNNNNNISIKNENGLSVNFFKLLSNNNQVFSTITSNDLTTSDESRENLLTYIAAINNSELISNLLQKQNSLNYMQIGNNMITPLLSAISIKNLEISEILINKGYNINDTTDIKFTPLHFASYYNLVKIVKLLLQKNADLTIKTKKEGETPLHLACRKGNFEIVNLLLNNGYSNIINISKSDNKTSLHLASTTSSLCTHTLLKYNADRNVKDNNKILLVNWL